MLSPFLTQNVKKHSLKVAGRLEESFIPCLHDPANVQQMYSKCTC